MSITEQPLISDDTAIRAVLRLALAKSELSEDMTTIYCWTAQQLIARIGRQVPAAKAPAAKAPESSDNWSSVRHQVTGIDELVLTALQQCNGSVWGAVGIAVSQNFVYRRTNVKLQEIPTLTLLEHLSDDFAELQSACAMLDSESGREKACDLLAVVIHLCLRLGMTEYDVYKQLVAKMSRRFSFRPAKV